MKMENSLNCVSRCEQQIQNILDNDMNELNEFIFDSHTKHYKAKAFILFHQAIYYALKEIEKEHHE